MILLSGSRVVRAIVRRHRRLSTAGRPAVRPATRSTLSPAEARMLSNACTLMAATLQARQNQLSRRQTAVVLRFDSGVFFESDSVFNRRRHFGHARQRIKRNR